MTDTKLLTREDVQNALPTSLKSAATQSLTDKLNQISSDPMIAGHIRENFVSYAGILKEGKFTTEAYLNAVTYVSYKVMGYTNQEAYQRTFPQRYGQLLADGRSQSQIAAYVTGYNKGKLVNLILEQTLVPVWILNQDLKQKAINQLATLMLSAGSEKVQVEAANSLLVHLKTPEVAKVDVSIGVREDEGLMALKKQMEEFAYQQRDAIESGARTADIAGLPLYAKTPVEAEFEEVADAKKNGNNS